MEEKKNIAEILAAAKEKKLALEADETAKKETELAQGESESLEKSKNDQAKIEAYNLKQQRLEEIKAQRSADAAALLEIRAKLKGDRQTIRSLELPEEDEAEFLKAIKDASSDESADSQSTRGEINERRKETKIEKNKISEDLKQLERDEVLELYMLEQKRDEISQELKKLHAEWKEAEALTKFFEAWKDRNRYAQGSGEQVRDKENYERIYAIARKQPDLASFLENLDKNRITPQQIKEKNLEFTAQLEDVKNRAHVVYNSLLDIETQIEKSKQV